MSDVKQLSTWIRFKVAGTGPLDPSLFEPLRARAHDGNGPAPVQDAYSSRIRESPEQCLLVIIWTREASSASPSRRRALLAGLEGLGAQAHATDVDFGLVAFWWRWTPGTELRTVRFPAPVAPATRRAVDALRPLVLAMGLGIDGSGARDSPYASTPARGWAVDDEDEFHDEFHDGEEEENREEAKQNKKTRACLWIHYWKDAAAEARYKSSEWRPPADGEAGPGSLAAEAFDRELRELGALGWEDVHVDFQRVTGTA
ncbi:hypothetical protein GGR56DRAFT_659202 [Xylariaceae sp. FL0804]|nr:hypothetical protein GGR56DRAFT_659202 [Xylariaceae sp. FL0804]